VAVWWAEIGLEVEVAEVPDLYSLVPAAGDDYWVGGGGAELDGGDPFSVTVLTLLGPLALSKSVPQLDALITASRDDLSVVSAESNAHNILLVSDKSGAGDTSVNVPKSEGLVPTGRDGKLTAGADDNVADKVVVATESLHGDAIGSLVFFEVPDDEGLVTRGGDQSLGGCWAAGDLGDPVTVALQGAPQIHHFARHDRFR